METKDLIKELRILEKSSKLGEQACICGEAANRLEELLQEIEISRTLEKSENHKENDDPPFRVDDHSCSAFRDIAGSRERTGVLSSS